jgi:protein involved in ribonucleotide reduction
MHIAFRFVPRSLRFESTNRTSSWSPPMVPGRGRLGAQAGGEVILNDECNRSCIRGVIAAGNTNFGDAYCRAGAIVSAKRSVPYLYGFERLGTTEDVLRVREGLDQLWLQQSRTPA